MEDLIDTVAKALADSVWRGTWDNATEESRHKFRRHAIAAIDAIMTPRPVDTAPKDGTAILAWSPIYGWLVVRWWETGVHPSIPDHWDDGEGCGDDATHWLPLPPPPKED